MSGIQWKGRELEKYGEIGSALCALETAEEAAEFWKAYVAYLSRATAKLVGGTPESVAASNIGYLMGYYSPEDRQRVYGLFEAFNVSHPIYGTTEPTSAAAVEGGKRWALGEFA